MLRAAIARSGLIFAAGIPVLALMGGCPGLLGLPTASPSPSGSPISAGTSEPTTAPTTAPTSAPTLAPTLAPTSAPTSTVTTGPTAAPTPKRSTGLVLADIEFNSDGKHAFKIRNIGTTDVDISKYALCYQAPNTSGKPYLRLNESLSTQKTVKANTAISISANATGSSSATVWFPGDDAAINVSAGTKTLGLQASGGALALYKDTDSASAFGDKAKIVDFVQWGNKPNDDYSRHAVAVDAGIWNKDGFAPAGVAGKELELVVPGATGSANWKLVVQD